MTRKNGGLDGAGWDKPESAASKIKVLPPPVYARVDRYPFVVRRLREVLGVFNAISLVEPELTDEQIAWYFQERRIGAEMRKPPGERNFGTSTAYWETDEGRAGVMLKPRRLRTRSPFCVARKPRHLSSKDQPEQTRRRRDSLMPEVEAHVRSRRHDRSH